MPKIELINIKCLVDNVNSIIEQSKSNIYKSMNSEMVKAYFEIDREIVEEEQKGKNRAEYGKAIVQNLSIELTKRHGKGFSKRNLETIRQFYLIYQKTHTLRAELSWSHYRLLMKIAEPQKRSFFEVECVNNNWSISELKSLMKKQMILKQEKVSI